MLVELAFPTFQLKVALDPATMLDGVALNELIVGIGQATVVAQVEVATVEEASVAWMVIEYAPGASLIVIGEVVAPEPQRSEIGAMPPVVEADHVMAVADETPAHETVNASAFAITGANARAPILRTDASVVRIFINTYMLVISEETCPSPLETRQR